MFTDLKPLETALRGLKSNTRHGFVSKVEPNEIHIEGLSRHAHVGDQIYVGKTSVDTPTGEIVSMSKNVVIAMLYGDTNNIGIGSEVAMNSTSNIFPDHSWIGRIIDAFGNPIDGKPLFSGSHEMDLKSPPPRAATRRGLGGRLDTSVAVFNTILPIARGQRIGIFAGSGVGKSTLLAEMARGVQCDVVIIALIGERGRELREFSEKVLGPEGMKRTVIIAATSDQSPLIKRRAAWTATSVAEYFRDQGLHVLLLMDSVTRFAEAHREVALTAGETPSLRAFPPSTANLIASLAERAGPGMPETGDITAIYTVLVAGSDMEEPVADITRGILDGHIVLDRNIAERGRFPAIDVSRSVSRSLPEIASKSENTQIGRVRRVIGVYEKAEAMIQTGLYTHGSDPEIDEAIKLWPLLEDFFSKTGPEKAKISFSRLSKILDSP